MGYACVYCGNRRGFSSLENLQQQLKEFGFPYPLSAFETLSYRSYLCESCGASDRDRLYKIYLQQSRIVTKESRTLDFAPSENLSAYLKSITENYRSADLLMENVDDKVDICNMKQYKNGTFDFFVCSHIMEHVNDDSKALSELYRVLAPGGRGILMTPIIKKAGVQDEDPKVTDVKERWRRFAQDDHVRLYEKKVFLQRVHNAGFKVRTYGYWNLNPIRLLQNGISLKTHLYIVEKPKA